MHKLEQKSKKILTLIIEIDNLDVDIITRTINSIPIHEYSTDIDILLLGQMNSQSTEILEKLIKQYPDVVEKIQKKDCNNDIYEEPAILNRINSNYIMRISSGDYLYTDNMGQYIEFLRKSDVDIIYSPFVVLESDGMGVLSICGEYQELVASCHETHNIDELEFIKLPTNESAVINEKVLHKLKSINRSEISSTNVWLYYKEFCVSNTLAYFKLPIYCRINRNLSNELWLMKHNYKHDEDMIFNMIDLFEKKQLSVEKKMLCSSRLVTFVIGNTAI